MDFGHTTISNLKGTDNRLWVHVIIVILFLPLGIFIMRKFSVTLKIDGTDQCISSRYREKIKLFQNLSNCNFRERASCA